MIARWSRRFWEVGLGWAVIIRRLDTTLLLAQIQDSLQNEISLL